MTGALIKRFCLDIGLNTSYDEEIFLKRLELYDKFFGYKKDYEVYKEETSRFRSDTEYFEYAQKVINNMIDAIKGTDAYSRFTEDESLKELNRIKLDVPKATIYNPDNVGKLYISVDMKQANFNVMKCYDKGMFGGADTWEEFVGKFTDLEHLKHMKHIRQVVLGHCSSNRQGAFMKLFANKLMHSLVDNKAIKFEDLVCTNLDEIVIRCDNDANAMDKLFAVKEVVEEKCEAVKDIPFNIELFKLHQVRGCKGYVKLDTFNNEVLAIKCVSSVNMPFVMRALLHEEVQEEDKYFRYEGMLSKVVDVPSIII